MTDLQNSIQKCILKEDMIKLPLEQLKNYSKVKKAIESHGGKYQKGSFFKFSSANEAKAAYDALSGGTSVDFNQETQFFPTEPSLARALVAGADIRYDGVNAPLILEPSAGTGSLIEHLPYFAKVHAVEKEERLHLKLVSNPNYHSSDVEFFNADFLKWNTKHRYDFVIANPPFSRNIWVDHVSKMWALLKVGGTLAVILPKSWDFISTKKGKALKDKLGKPFFKKLNPSGSFDKTKIETYSLFFFKSF